MLDVWKLEVLKLGVTQLEVGEPFYVHQCVLCSICLDIGRKCIILLYFVYFLCWTVGVNVSIRGKRLVFQYA